jgi:hypothetical protein
MTAKKLKTVRPDAKGRITLGVFAQGISSFIVFKDKNNRIILEPRVEIPAREKWLFDNTQALAQVKNGLKDAVHGRVKKRGSFASYAINKVIK